MTRPELFKSDQHPYHVMSRCMDQKMFPLSLNEVWTIMIELLERCHREKGLRIHAFVLMGNHFHLLCHTPTKNIDEIMQFLLKSSSQKIGESHIWTRYKWSLISSPAHYYQVYRYIYQNPIRAGLVERVELWPYSSLKIVPFPLCTHVPMSFCGEEGERIWLNQRYSSEDQQLIRLGLRKFQFDVSQRNLNDFRKLTLPIIKKGP
jgi:putative transposase